MATSNPVRRKTTATTGENIPGDLLPEIFVRLPVKSLLRCKSVSKPWLSAISNPKFIISHLKHNITTPGSAETFLVYNTINHTIYLFDDLDSHDFGAPLAFPHSIGDFCFEPCVELINSCNGIVCVSVSNCPRKIRMDKLMTYTYLWNPATKHSKLIPLHNIRNDINSFAIGFGFDPIGKDYKVVRVVCGRLEHYAAEVYSANTNLWRKVEPSPHDSVDRDNFHVCVNGFLCWTGSNGIVAFDLNKELFTCGIQLPAKPFDFRIIDLNDCIAVAAFKENQSSRMINIWTLDDESCLRDGGVEASWTKMLSIHINLPMGCRVYGYYKGGDLLLKSEHGVWFLYNTNKKQARVIPGAFGQYRPIKYNESLVSITGFQQANWTAPNSN